jgi:hypothetical protein
LIGTCDVAAGDRPAVVANRDADVVKRRRPPVLGEDFADAGGRKDRQENHKTLEDGMADLGLASEELQCHKDGNQHEETFRNDRLAG